MRALGLKTGGSQYIALRRRMDTLGIDYSHFKGQGWNIAGEFIPTPARPLSDILVADSTYLTTSHLKSRLVREGLLEWRCSRCGITEWQGRPAPLDLDHINGDRADHRLENLRLLCPNCHAQTPTYRRKKAA